MIDAFDFLEPMAEHDLSVALGICEYHNQDDDRNKKLFKCKIGDNHVSLDMSDQKGLAKARMQCSARSDLFVEPVGGAGHMILDPTPDTKLASDIFDRSTKRQRKYANLNTTFGFIVILFLVQIILLWFNYMI